MTDAAPAIEKSSECANITPSLDKNGLTVANRSTSESDISCSASKRRCLISKAQPSGDAFLNDGDPPGANMNFNVNNFVSEIKITVSDYISQQYLVRGSPNYKVLKVIISIEFFPSMFFCGEAAKKNKYRWFKVEEFGGW